jgi:hypothetical protein
MGYYNSNWTDENLASIAENIGAHSIRPSLPEYFVAQYGYNIRVPAFNSYVNTHGMKELTCFVEGPSAAHRETTTYPGATGQSKMFANLYEPIWNSDGTVNQNNYYAYYLYQLQAVYGDKVRFWEIINEPDFSYSPNIGDWSTRPPAPGEMVNIQAPIFSYIRMLHISYDIIKRYRPDSYVTTGGVGYSQFVDALMRYTENPNGGAVTAQYPNTGGAYIDALSFHSYPSYSLHYWDTVLNGFRYTRTSDYAASKVMEDRQGFVDVLTRYGYNGMTRPAKHILMSETNIGRRTSDDRTGSDEMQRNFGIKTLVLSQKNDVKQLYYYQLGESVNAPAANQSVSGSDEMALMGLYENLLRDAPNSQRTTQLGKAFATTSKLLYGAYYDAARTAALALPAGIEGAAFNKNGTYTYVLWAKALVDNLEYATAVYSFPGALSLGSMQRYEWDYSTTNTKTTQSALAITLGTNPSFFTEGPSTGGTTTTPPTSGSGTGCAGTGTLTREQWALNGTAVSATAAAIAANTAPASTAPVAAFEAPDQFGYNYGARLRGYLCPPQTGAYTFFVVGDDEAELWLSSDADPARKVRIAACSGWTASNRDFTRYPAQQSAPVALTAGTRYYVEALHKQGWGPGYVAVAWRLPDGSQAQPIPASNIIPFSTTAGRGVAAASSTATATGNSLTRTALSVFPNPFSSNATIEFNTLKTGTVTVELFNLQGQLVRKLYAGEATGGTPQRVSLNAPGLSTGIYLVRLTTGNEVVNQRVSYIAQ